MNSSDEGTLLLENGASLIDFLTVLAQLEDRALAGLLVTRSDVDKLLQHKDLADAEVHCFASGAYGKSHSPTMSISKLRKGQSNPTGRHLASLVYRHRTDADINAWIKNIEDRQRHEHGVFQHFKSKNYEIFAIMGQGMSAKTSRQVLTRLIRVCEIVRRCSVNYQNIRRYSHSDVVKLATSFKHEQLSRESNDQFSRGFISKAQFVAKLSAKFDCIAKSFDIDLDDLKEKGNISEIFDFVLYACKSLELITSKSVIQKDVRRLAGSVSLQVYLWP